ncbi:MAG TPA: beta-N-acetylhexosaminidase [Candidatus Hydrogenedentes bacterium]|nr:beta-N-acetylhexosaminidase [Candidatus Hydrogenedentota bacterium]HQH51618.1 beta-N-acetylhexosaminidase [Candidatus Hydrogenedentota bacterium]
MLFEVALSMWVLTAAEGEGAEQPVLIPLPAQMEAKPGRFGINAETAIVYDANAAGAEAAAGALAEYLRPPMQLPLPVRAGESPAASTIFFGSGEGLEQADGEGYRLTVTPEGVVVHARAAAGLFYGAQTLRQLLPPQAFAREAASSPAWSAPCVEIMDRPRFAWRGMMVDTARHFMPKEFLKKYIDVMAMHKFNRLHLHLTDDQGWRVEIKKYPKLTEVGAWRAETQVGKPRGGEYTFDGIRHGGFYTQDDIRELVAYAAARHVTLVPEIEMPGHAQAAIASYPELGCTGEQLPVRTRWGVNENVFNVEESTILFLQDVLSEVLELFPGEFIHIGGDECPKKQWKESPRVQERMRELGIETENAMQSWFIGRMDAFLTERGRRLIGWDEILEGGLAPGATVMSWRGIDGGIAAAKANHDVVMAPTTHTYFDYYQSKNESEPLAIGGFLPIERVYEFEPVPSQLSEMEARHILGAQAQMWTEYIKTPEYLEYMAFPRECAMAEVVWTLRERREFGGFMQRLRIHLERLAALGVNYRPLD